MVAEIISFCNILVIFHLHYVANCTVLMVFSKIYFNLKYFSVSSKFTASSLKRQKRSRDRVPKPQRMRTSEGLTVNLTNAKRARVRKERDRMSSPVTYPTLKWTELGSQEYYDAIGDMNAAYRMILMTGKDPNQVQKMLDAETKKDFLRERRNIRRNYKTHVDAGKPVLNLRVATEFVLHPHKYGRGATKQMPTLRERTAKEKILTFEQYMGSLNVFMCSVCLECRIKAKPCANDPKYVCGSCKDRKDDRYYVDNNLHPVWYLIDDDGNYVLDEQGNRATQYHIPEELSCLTMYEKLLIRRCANFVPSVHLKNGVFGIKGHCVTFPQDITEMCDELPQKKDTLVTFIRNIGNKDTSAVFPTRLTVNRNRVITALKWLQKHNPFYANVNINKDNLDWMDGADEVNVGTDGIVLGMKETATSRMKESEEEHVSKAHSTDIDGDDVMPMRTVHANETNKVPTGRQAKQIKELADIARTTDQTEKIMNFPPIDHDSAIS